jgi:hypothetical protein
MSTQIAVGQGQNGPAAFDLDTLIRTRLLLQANSGGGKSFALRRLLEQIFGKVQAIVIDPEGEFSTLREKFGYVLIGKGGEAPADVRSAGLVAEKLLELHASAVCDLYEMKPNDRPRWVKEFLTALMNAPKQLWHPVVVVVDESHKFAPEKGKGESEASEAMLTLATAGRKRGYCAVFATQRLGKLNKDAAAELLNVMVGRTFLDVDRERAADILGIQKSGKAEFDQTLRNLAPGQFYVLGPAIATSPVLVKVGPVQTTHPEIGAKMTAAAPTPTPDEVKSLLPKLADLPKEAEQRARTVEELQGKIRSLQSQLSDRPRPEIDETAVKQAMESALAQRDREHDRQLSGYQQVIEKMQSSLAAIAKQAAQFVSLELPREHHETPTIELPSRPVRTVTSEPSRPTARTSRRSKSGEMLPRAERLILTALAQYPNGRTKVQIALLCGYAHSGGGFNNAIGSLRSQSYVEGYDLLRITSSGSDALGDYDPLPHGDELLQYWYRNLGKAERTILEVVAAAWPKAMTKEDVAEDAGYEPSGGGFNNALGRLRTLELIGGRGEIKASDDLFD